MQQEATLNWLRVILPIVAFDKIAYKIADQNRLLAEGKKTMCYVVQNGSFFTNHNSTLNAVVAKNNGKWHST